MGTILIFLSSDETESNKTGCVLINFQSFRRLASIENEVLTNKSDLTCYEFKQDKIYPPLKAEEISDSPMILQFHDFYSPGTFKDTDIPSDDYLEAKEKYIDFVLGLKSSTSTLSAMNFHGPGQGSPEQSND